MCYYKDNEKRQEPQLLKATTA